MYKIAVLGDYNSIYGFAALGLDTFPVEDPTEGKEKLNRLAAGEYAVIYITEQLAAQLSAEISKYSEALMPAIIQRPVSDTHLQKFIPFLCKHGINGTVFLNAAVYQDKTSFYISGFTGNLQCAAFFLCQAFNLLTEIRRHTFQILL